MLFPGNPYAFSNGSEIAEKLERAGVDFEAVPGLIVELAAPVMSGIPLTIEGRSASIGFGLVKGAETVVLRLASGWWESGITALLADGRDPDTPAALILNPGQPGQHRVSAPLGELARKAATYGLRGDALLVLGPGVSHGRAPRHDVEAAAARPADPDHSSPPPGRPVSSRAGRPRRFGGRDPDDRDSARCRLDDRVSKAIAHLEGTALVIFASANAVDIFFQMLLATGERRARAARLKALRHRPGDRRVARRPRGCGLSSSRPSTPPKVWPRRSRAGRWTGCVSLVPRAEVARDALPSLLAKRGAEVEILPVYRAMCPSGGGRRAAAPLQRRGRRRDHVHELVHRRQLRPRVPRRPPARRARRRRDRLHGPGHRRHGAQARASQVAIVAREYTTHGLVQAIAESAARK